MRYFGMHESIWFNLPSLAFKWAYLWQFLNSSLWVHWWNFRSKWLDDMRYRGIDILLKRNTFAAAAKSLRSCLTLCDPIDSSPPGSPVPGILQARILEWVAISFSSAWKWKVKVQLLSRVQLFATPWTAAYQSPLSMGFSRQEYWSGVPLLSLEYL